MNRKSFLNLTAKAGLFLGVTPSLLASESGKNKADRAQIEEKLLEKKSLGNLVGLATEPLPKVRVGMIGMGNRGSVLIQMF